MCIRAWSLEAKQPQQVCGSGALEGVESEVASERLHELRELDSFHLKNQMYETILYRLAVRNNITATIVLRPGTLVPDTALG